MSSVSKAHRLTSLMFGYVILGPARIRIDMQANLHNRLKLLLLSRHQLQLTLFSSSTQK